MGWSSFDAFVDEQLTKGLSGRRKVDYMRIPLAKLGPSNIHTDEGNGSIIHECRHRSHRADWSTCLRDGLSNVKAGLVPLGKVFNLGSSEPLGSRSVLCLRSVRKSFWNTYSWVSVVVQGKCQGLLFSDYVSGVVFL